MNFFFNNKKFIFSLFTLCILLISKSLFSQGIPDPPIEDAPVENVNSLEQSQNSNLSEPKKDNSEYRLFTIGTFSYNSIPDYSHMAVANGMFSEKSFAALINFDMNLKPLMKGNSDLVFRTDVEGVVSTLFTEDTPLFDHNSGDYIRLDELFVEATPVSQVSFLFGKYRHIFSPGLFQNPLDRHNPTATLPGEPAAREGTWMSMLSFDSELKSDAVSRIRFSMAFLPGFFLGDDGLPVWERDVRVIDVTSPVGFTTETESYDNSYAGGFARLYLNLFKGDFNVIYYYTERQHQAGFSYSRYFLNAVEWHGEILFYEEPHSRYAVPDSSANFYTDALTGLRLNMGNNLSFVLEYLYRQDNPRHYPSDIAAQQHVWLGLVGTDNSSNAMTPLQSYIILTMMLVDIKDILDMSVNVIANPFDSEALFSIRTDLKVDKSSKLSLAGLFKAGNSDSFYGSYLPFDYQIRLEYYIALI